MNMMRYHRMSWSKQQESHIEEGPINQAIKLWQDAQADRIQTCASPSTLTQCPRVVWRLKHKVDKTNPKTWAFKQRLMLGRNFENVIAEQLDHASKLIYHWKDDKAGESVKFSTGRGETRLEGTPDLLIRLGDKVAISDAKTGRSDGYGYTAIDDTVWEDQFWYKYKLQVTAYYLLCHKNRDWFKQQGKYNVKEEFNPLPLPEICHLFSFALDDGVNRREFTWVPTREDLDKVLEYTKRWNNAYNSETEPACKCTDKDSMFCEYADLNTKYVTKKGKTLYKECCK